MTSLGQICDYLEPPKEREKGDREIFEQKEGWKSCNFLKTI